MFYVGLRIPVDQRQIGSALPMHLVDVLTVSEGAQTFADASGNVIPWITIVVAFCIVGVYSILNFYTMALKTLFQACI